MRALTLSQPWAELVALGVKQFETRSWSTPYRGTLVIHAARKGSGGVTTAKLNEMADAWGFDRRVDYGAAIAVCELVDVRRVEDVYDDLSFMERRFGDYSPGRYAWQLADVRRFLLPIPARGALGLWTPPIEVREAVLG